MALLVELEADRPDPAVHHVAGRDRVGAGLGVGDRGFRDQLDAEVVLDLAVGVGDAAVAVRGVLAEADVGDHGEVGVRVLQRPHRHLDDPLVVVGAGAVLVLGGGDAEQQHRPDPGRVDLGGVLDQVGDRVALDAGHRRDLFADLLAGDDEGGHDQVGRRELGLADERAEGVGAAQAAHAGGGEGHPVQSREGLGFAREASSPAASFARVQARGLTKRFGDREALRGVSFEAAPGELVAVIGPNGAGKTTLLSILAGILPPDGGEVEVEAGAVGWVPQQAALYRRLTVEENLLLFARLEKHPDPRASVEEMLELSGLGERRGDVVARLSGGNQQRINIAIGLLSRPSVLLLDEPSVGLDPRQRARLWEFVSGLAVRGTTVIFSTHDIQEAERYGRRMLVLADGEALFDGSADELREAVRHDAADPAASDRDFETAFVTYLQHRGH